jgi:hypothetical protein
LEGQVYENLFNPSYITSHVKHLLSGDIKEEDSSATLQGLCQESGSRRFVIDLWMTQGNQNVETLQLRNAIYVNWLTIVMMSKDKTFYILENSKTGNQL